MNFQRPNFRSHTALPPSIDCCSCAHPSPPPTLSGGCGTSGQAASASASTSQPAAATSAQPNSGAPSTSHPAADLLASRLATSTPPATQGGSPQLPVPLKKKRYQAEPAPSLTSPSGVEVGAAADSASVGVHPSSVADKQV